MRSQESREGTTLVIGTALFLFVGVLVAGGLLLYLVGRSLGDGGPVFLALVLVASAVAVVYLVRGRRDR